MSGLEERCLQIVQSINSLCDMQGASDLEKATYFQEVASRDSHTSDNVAKFFGWKELLPPPGVPEPTDPPTLTSLNPATAAVGDPELTLECIGTNFSPGYSHINFGGTDQLTTFVDATKVTMVLHPDTAPGAAEVPVYVRTLIGQTEPQIFSLTAPVGLTEAMGLSAAEPEEELEGVPGEVSEPSHGRRRR